MARIQILELPAKVVGDVVETPFTFVIDQASRNDLIYLEQADLSGFLADTGASSVLVTEGTFDIPANDFSEAIAPATYNFNK